jgi:amidohydrolase
MVDSWQLNLDRMVDVHAPELVAVRRHLHAHPELSGEEYQTSQYLLKLLQDEGFDCRIPPEGRGLIVDVAATGAEKIILRADIDALGIQDAKDVPYRSCHDGVMHACGHDAHSAMLLGAVLALRDLQDAGQLPWPTHVRGLFQPAEETASGARELMAAGALEGVQAILGVHVDPAISFGTIGLRNGISTANCDELRIVLSGPGGHAARPHETADPIAAAAGLLTTIYSTIPRVTDSRDAIVITFGQIAGGKNSNVIPETVHLQGTLRTLDIGVRRRTKEKLRKICLGVAEATGVGIALDIGAEIDSVCCDDAMTDVLRRAACDLLGPEKVHEILRASMGSEDFSVYLKQIPGAMFRLGCTSSGKEGIPLHSACFDIEEEAIAVGAKMLARGAVIWSEPSPVGEPAPATAWVDK